MLSQDEQTMVRLGKIWLTTCPAWERRGASIVFRVCGLGLAETLCLPSEYLPRLPEGLECAGRQVTSCVQVLMFWQHSLMISVDCEVLWEQYHFGLSSAQHRESKYLVCCLWGAPLMSWLQEEVLLLTPALTCLRNVTGVGDMSAAWLSTHRWRRLCWQHPDCPFVLPHGCLLVVWISHCKVGGTPVGLSCFQGACFVKQCCHVGEAWVKQPEPPMRWSQLGLWSAAWPLI